MNLSNDDASISNRFICAGSILGRGIVAPLTRPFAYAYRAANGELMQGKDGDFFRAAWDPCASARANADGLVIVCSFLLGAVTGSLILSTSLFEAPYQLVRSGKPQKRPWLQRKCNW